MTLLSKIAYHIKIYHWYLTLECNTGIKVGSVREKFIDGYQKTYYVNQIQIFCLIHVMISQFKEKSPPSLNITSQRTSKNESLSHNIF